MFNHVHSGLLPPGLYRLQASRRNRSAPSLLWVCQGLAARRAVYQVVIFFRDSPKEYRLRLNPHPVGASECLLRLQVTPSPGVEPLLQLIVMETTLAGQK